MPTVLRLGALRVVVYPNDHRPAHVHVMGNGCEAVFVLRRRPCWALLRENFGFSRSAIAGIERDLIEHLELLLKAWEEIHGVG